MSGLNPIVPEQHNQPNLQEAEQLPSFWAKSQVLRRCKANTQN